MERAEIWLKRLLLAALFNTALWLSGVGCLVQVALMLGIMDRPLALLMTMSLVVEVCIWLARGARVSAAGCCQPGVL